MKYMTNKNKMESTGLAGIGGPIGAMHPIFVSKYQSASMVRPNYCIQDDIITDNIITTNKNNKLVRIPSDRIAKSRIRMFKYKGQDPNAKLMTILNSVNSIVNREFIYETVSGKELIDDNQIEYDEDFEYIDFNAIKDEITNESFSLLNKYLYLVKPDITKRYTIVENAYTDRLTRYHPNIHIMKDNDLGYFAMNSKTFRRTKYYESVNDIVISKDLIEEDKNGRY